MHRLVQSALVVVVLAAASGCQYISSKIAMNHYVDSQVLADKGNLDAALEELAKAIRLDPNLSVAHAAMGDIHRRRGDYESARKSYEAACETNPYAFRCHYNLGVTYQLLAEAVKAADAFQTYLRKAIGVYLRAAAIRPDDFDTNLNLSACYFQLGKYNLAEQYCQAAIQINTQSAPAYGNLGIINDSQGKLYEAVLAYKNSLEIDAHQPMILLNLGSSYVRQGRLKLALSIFELAAREAPDDPTPWEQMGGCHYHLHDLDQSLECYQKAASIDPRSADAHRGLGVVYMSRFLIEQGKTDLRDKALEAWNTSLELRPDQKDLISLLQKYTPKSRGPQL